VINHWLGVLDEIELNTKAILGIVEDYHNDAGSVIHHRGGLKGCHSRKTRTPYGD
jgi:hypothetical protein